MQNIQHYPYVKNGNVHYRDAGFFVEHKRRNKRWFPICQYMGHTPHNRYEQIIIVRRTDGSRCMLSAMGHFLQYERMIRDDKVCERK